MNTRIVGRRGEDIAAEYLVKNKYKIIERNFNCRYGEIDLIVWDGNAVIFVEVKARKNDKFGLPRESVNLHKQQTIVQCANYWLYLKKQIGTPVRFDVVEILDGKVFHWKDAFRA